MNIPFHKSHVYKNEGLYLNQVLESGQWSGDRDFSKRCERLLQEEYGFNKVLLTPSCTAALELMALILDLKPDDEVIIPSFTFPTTASSMALRGAIPRFVDVDPGTLNLTLETLKPAVNDKTKAIMVVHYGGLSCEIEAIAKFCKEQDLFLLEDAAQCAHAYYNSKALGSFGDFGAMSFHETKNISCGEGGALFINNPDFVEKAEILREKGTDRSKFLRGEVDKYSWKKIGSSFLLSEFNSAVLLAQLEGAKEITQRRLDLWDRYFDAFKVLEDHGHIKRPQVLEAAKGNGHIFWLLLNSSQEQSELLAHLKKNGIASTSHFVPLHSSDAGKIYAKTQGDLKLTEDIANRILRLPMYYDLKGKQEYVIENVLSFFS